MYDFAAIDFETANYDRDSACAIGVSIVRNGRIAGLERRLIRPPSSIFEFTYIHGLTWKDVRKAPRFAEVWQELLPLFEDVNFLVAHNAPFDRGVLEACCARSGITPPSHRFVCTVQIARNFLKIRPAKLSNVCQRLQIPLDHHEAGSDAEACARILLVAVDGGWRLD